MRYKESLAALLLSAALVSAPALMNASYAQDASDQSTSHKPCGEHHHMSQDKVDLLRSTMKKVHEDNKAVFEDMHKLYEKKQAILGAETFNKAEYLSVEGKIEQEHAKLAKARSQAFASIADKFTPEERQRLGRMMKHHHHHGMHHGGWHDGHSHEGWQKHDDKKDDMSDKDQAPSDATPVAPTTDSAQ